MTNRETRWRTPLPFPVQVVERVEVIDQLSRGKLTTEYRYHHGYWDGAEREFRGFGMVEQLDTETFADFTRPALHGPDARSSRWPTRTFSPPLLTKTWFHLGPVGDEFAARCRGRLQRASTGRTTRRLLPRPAGTMQFLQIAADPRHGRDALRSLRGQRRCAPSSTPSTAPSAQDRPYTVTEHASTACARRSPPAGGDGQRQRIFFPHPLAQRTTQWERGDEPMTQFAFTDDYDAYGQPRRQVSLAVPRHRDYRAPGAGRSALSGNARQKRSTRNATMPQRYMVDRVAASTSFEILNDGSPAVFDLYRQIQAGTASTQAVRADLQLLRRRRLRRAAVRTARRLRRAGAQRIAGPDRGDTP